MAAGQRHPRALATQPLLDATAWLVDFHRFREQNFLALGALLEEMKAQDASDPQKS